MAIVPAYNSLAELLGKFRMIPGILKAEMAQHAFGCRDDECALCLQEIISNRQSIVLTGASSLRYGININALTRATDRPVINCVRNDTRVDAYVYYFGYMNENQSPGRLFAPEQILLHGYNSWAINSPGTWKSPGTVASFFPNVKRQAEKEGTFTVSAVAAEVPRYLLYMRIFVQRQMAEMPVSWRNYLRLYPLYRKLDVAYWPLSRSAHIDRRVDLMQRWFDLSAWAKSFVIGLDKLAPATEIADRHNRFIETVSPVRQTVFFAAPEFAGVFPERIRKIFQDSRRIMLRTLSTNAHVAHVDVDYAGCKLQLADFWVEGAMYLDPVHPNYFAQEKITTCITDAMSAAGIRGFGQKR